MDLTHSKTVENNTLQTFKTHRPSEYFSHLNDDQSFNIHNAKIENLYRFGLCMPPEFFDAKKVIDLGSGTGEHTVSLSRWGSQCTLIEMNDEALERAKEVFRKYAPNIDDHTFINTSLYDIDIKALEEKFDIAHSRGVFTHVSNKPLAFNILARLAKPGGYVIYGDRNSAGGIQEMLQRYAIYKLGGVSEKEILATAESLFSDDITRSQQSVPRTREAIIYDRWVIQQQDDPSAEDVLDMFKNEGLTYVSSWPRIDYAGRGLSTFTNPTKDSELKKGATLAENLWMMLKGGEDEKINLQTFNDYEDYIEELNKTAKLFRNLQVTSSLETDTMISQFNKLQDSANKSNSKRLPLISRINTFIAEVTHFLKLIDNDKDLNSVKSKIDSYKLLFKGYAGVRHVDYVAYKQL